MQSSSGLTVSTCQLDRPISEQAAQELSPPACRGRRGDSLLGQGHRGQCRLGLSTVTSSALAASFRSLSVDKKVTADYSFSVRNACAPMAVVKWVAS